MLWPPLIFEAGKTVTAASVLNRLKEKNNISSVRVNCWENDTCFEVLDAIILALKILRAEEHRTSVKLEKLRSHLRDQPLIVVLDDIDQLQTGEMDAIAHHLCALGNVGIVCISQSSEAFLALDGRIQSRLNPVLVHFPRYTRSELLQILSQRAELSLASEARSDRSLGQIAETSEGDARLAIRNLRGAAELAEADGRASIGAADLAEQCRALAEARHAHVLRALTQDHRILYDIVADRKEIGSSELWNDYLEHCGSINRRPIASRTFSNYANRLAQMGLVAVEQARAKGNVRLFKTEA